MTMVGDVRKLIRGGIFRLVASSLSLIRGVGVKFVMAIAHYCDRVPQRFHINAFMNYYF